MNKIFSPYHIGAKHILQYFIVCDELPTVLPVLMFSMHCAEAGDGRHRGYRQPSYRSHSLTKAFGSRRKLKLLKRSCDIQDAVIAFADIGNWCTTRK